MSTVYVAFDTTLERRVAIKVMHRDIAADSAQLERFRREARAIAQLSSPYVVGVIDAGEEGEEADDGRTPYIVLEYVAGETLKERIRRCKRLEIDEAVAYAIEIARALEVAHDHRIVHRDIKPQNVLIDEEGTAKVTDFGIARTLTQEGLTADGRVLGTTDYVSPEQALGRDVTGQSDLYSLGIVLFEMLTGDIPFHGENQVSVAMKHVRDELPDVQVRRPDVSSALAAVVDRATAKDLDERYKDADEMIVDLEEALSIETARTGHAGTEAAVVLRTLPEEQRRRLPLRMRHPTRLVVALALLAVIALIVLIFLADNAHRGAPIATPLDSPITATSTNPDKTPPTLQPFDLASDAAHDFDPLGDNQLRAPRDGQGGDRRRPGHVVVDRELPRRPREGGRRDLRRHQAGGRRAGDDGPVADARLCRDDLRRNRRRRRPPVRRARIRSGRSSPRCPPRGPSSSSSSPPTPRATATTCCGSPRCRRAATTVKVSEIALYR